MAIFLGNGLHSKLKAFLYFIIIILLALPFLSQAEAQWQLPPIPDDYETIDTEYFIIRYDPDKINSTDINFIINASSYAHDKVSSFFNGYDYRTTIVIASDHKEYEKLIGIYGLSNLSMGSGWGDTYSGRIIIKSPEQVKDFRMVLAHELTHIALRSLSDEYISSMPEWFTEGIAVFVSEDLGNERRKFMEDRSRENRYASIDDIERAHVSSYKPNTSTYDIYLAYTQSGLIIEYINDTYGKEGVYAILYDHGFTNDIKISFMKWLGKTPEDINMEMLMAIKEKTDIKDGIAVYKNIHGSLLDHKGCPVEGQRLEFRSLRDDLPIKNMSYFVMTDSSGHFNISLAYGPYTIVSYKDGYDGIEMMLPQDYDSRMPLNITLDGSKKDAEEHIKEQGIEENRRSLLFTLGIFSLISVAFVVIASWRWGR
jgi:hypothetical protein